MPERMLRQYGDYERRRGLPSRRIELHLAQIAMLIAKTMGGAKDATLKDFLFDPPEESADRLQALKAEIGFSPRTK